MKSFPLGITRINADNSPVHVTVLLSDLNNTVLNKKLIACYQLILCLRNRNLLGCCIPVQYKKMRISSAPNFIVLGLMCHALISA